MAFKWHSEKAKSNFEKHGVSFEEAESVFDDPLQVHYPDYAHSIGEQRYICLGDSNQGAFDNVGIHRKYSKFVSDH